MINTELQLTAEQALQQAIAHHQAGQLQDAERLYRAILQIQPNHPDANHNMGVLAVQVNQPAASLPYFKTALEANQNHGQYWLSYVDALIQSGQTDAAKQVLEQGRQRGLKGEAVEALVGRLKEGAGQKQSNMEHHPAFKELPSLAVATQNNIKKNQNKKRIKPNEVDRKSAVHKKQEPSQQEINALLALFAEGRYVDAMTLAQTMTVGFPLHGFGWKLLGVLFSLMGRGADALLPMQKAAALLPNDAEAHSNLGTALQNLGQLDDAVASYRRALQIKPDFAEAHSNLGIVLKDLGQLDGAVASYRRALQIRPDYAKAHSNLGIALQDLGQLNDAVASYRRALQIKSDFAEAHYNLGIALKDLGQLDDAVARYRRALEIKPDYAEAHNNLGIVLKDLGQLDDAVASCRRALEIRPDYAEAHSNLGTALQDLGQLDDAVSSYRRALQIKPDFAEVHSNLGTALRDIGQLDDAVASCRRALEIKPDYAEAHYNLGNALLDLDSLGLAAAAYQKALDIDPVNIGLDAAVYSAILHYLDGNYEECRSKLHASQLIMTKTDSKHKNARIYWFYLDKLLLWHLKSYQNENQTQEMGVLHVVGESHSLSAHGVVVRYKERKLQCVAEWISGCKQWHLGNDKANKYKHKFEAVMARLPCESTILLAIGEIDCRHDEGIIKAWKKYPDKSLAEITQSTVEAYINYVSAIGKRFGHKMIVGGVPCPNFPLDALEATEAEQFVRLIRSFNTLLKNMALSTGMDFLDVHALTDGGDGIAIGDCHIDSKHLLPSAVIDAFDRHRLQGSAGRV